MDKKTSVSGRLVKTLASRRFFWFILALFVLQAAWIALSGQYPLAFDEDFHLGIIKLYAHHISPFWASQPENADRFGAVARDPSYLYQYLMSFPYRLISLFTHDQTIIVIWLRFINIGLFAGGLALFRRLLLKMMGAGRAIVHYSLLVFVLLPIVPLLGTQINYDNLLIPVVALALLLAVRFDELLAKDKRLDLPKLLQLFIVCLLACLVKYVFLPIFVAIIGFLIVRIWQKRRAVGGLKIAATKSWRSIGVWPRTGLIIGLIVVAGLFGQRIGYNLVRYHAPVPDCSKVLRLEQCREYGPWTRDYELELNKPPHKPSRSPLYYSGQWFYGMWVRTFFAVSGSSNDYETKGPLALPGMGAIFFGSLGIIAFAVSAKRLFKIYEASVIWLFLGVAATYGAALWLEEYMAFLRTAQPVAINGRYLVPLLLPLLTIAITSVAILTRRRPRLRLALALTCAICLVWGGGVLTFILRSNDRWFWPNQTVRNVNRAVHNVVGPRTPGYDTPTAYLR